MELLTPQVRAYLKNLLPQYVGQLAPATTWADEIKNNREWRYTGVQHYVDISVAPPKECRYDDKTDCPDNKCIVGAIYNNTVLASCDANGNPSALQEIAVKFLAHFVGDITQPLHACGRQRGGNDAKAPYDGRESQLHGIWDYEMIQTVLPRLFNGDQNQWAADIVRRIRSGEFDTSNWVTSTDIFATTESKNSAVAVEWVTETNGLNCGTVWGDYDDDMTQDFSKTYTDKHWPMVDLQVAKGGYRLADLLNKLLSNCNPLPTPPPNPETEVIAVSTISVQSFECKNTECAMGNLIADCMLSETQAELSMMNAGGIRSSLLTGNVTVGMIYGIAPFDNKVVVREMTGERIQLLLTRIFASNARLGRYPQFGGIRFKHDKAAGVVSDITVNGQPLEPTRLYKFASLDFIWTGGEGILETADRATGTLTGVSSKEALVSCIRKTGVINAKIDNRLGFRKETTSTALPTSTLATSTSTAVVTATSTQVVSSTAVETQTSIVTVTSVRSTTTAASATTSVVSTATSVPPSSTTVLATSTQTTTRDTTSVVSSSTSVPPSSTTSVRSTTTASPGTTSVVSSATTSVRSTTTQTVTRGTTSVLVTTTVTSVPPSGTTSVLATTSQTAAPGTTSTKPATPPGTTTECTTESTVVTTTVQVPPSPTEIIYSTKPNDKVTTPCDTETDIKPAPTGKPAVTIYSPHTVHYSDVAPGVASPAPMVHYENDGPSKTPEQKDKPESEPIILSSAQTCMVSFMALFLALFI
jgi:hypothetical protein